MRSCSCPPAQAATADGCIPPQGVAGIWHQHARLARPCLAAAAARVRSSTAWSVGSSPAAGSLTCQHSQGRTSRRHCMTRNGAQMDVLREHVPLAALYRAPDKLGRIPVDKDDNVRVGRSWATPCCCYAATAAAAVTECLCVTVRAYATAAGCGAPRWLHSHATRQSLRSSWSQWLCCLVRYWTGRQISS